MRDHLNFAVDHTAISETATNQSTLTFLIRKRQLFAMVRRVLSLLLLITLLGVTGQSAAYAARGPDPMQAAQMTMSMADCMKMMDQSASEKTAKPAKHKGCTPADCLNYMIACAGIAAATPDTAAPKLAAYDRRVMHLAGLVNPLRGRSPPPDIQPPIA